MRETAAHVRRRETPLRAICGTPREARPLSRPVDLALAVLTKHHVVVRRRGCDEHCYAATTTRGQVSPPLRAFAETVSAGGIRRGCSQARRRLRSRVVRAVLRAHARLTISAASTFARSILSPTRCVSARQQRAAPCAQQCLGVTR